MPTLQRSNLWGWSWGRGPQYISSDNSMLLRASLVMRESREGKFALKCCVRFSRRVDRSPVQFFIVHAFICKRVLSASLKSKFTNQRNCSITISISVYIYLGVPWSCWGISCTLKSLCLVMKKATFGYNNTTWTNHLVTVFVGMIFCRLYET